MEQGVLNTAQRRGMEKGMEKGIKKGARKSKLEIAQKMLLRGDSIEEVADLLELDLEEIKTLKK